MGICHSLAVVVKLASILQPFGAWLPALLAVLLCACDPPVNQALRELDAAGIEPSASSLLHATETGDLVNVARLLEVGVHTGRRDAAGRTALRIAVDRGDLAGARLLLAHGADPNAPADDGHAIAGIAANLGKPEVLEELLTAGADPESTLPGDDGERLLPWAIRQRNSALVSALLAAGADPNGQASDGAAACHLALRLHWADGMELLADAGADWNLPDADGRSALENALLAADLDTTAFLLAHGARPGEDGWSPWLWRAFERRDARCARLLLRHGAAAETGPALLEAAAAAGNGTFVKLLLDFGIRPGRALEIACANGDAATAKLILACGVSPNHGQVPFLATPLAAAIRGGHDSLAAHLLEVGASPDVRLPEGQKPLHLAVAKGCRRTVDRLLAAGADPNEGFAEPVSPAFIAHVRPGIMRWVLVNDTNASPLMLAADAGDIATATALLQAGAEKTIWTRNSKIWPINFASRRNDIKMMRVLLGRDPENEDRRILISLSEQRARVFDAGGTEIHSSRISSGRKGFETPTGEFVITNKYRDWTSTLYDAKMPHFQRLSCSDFGFHAGNVPGFPASHGCIRVPAADAARLFAITRTGDRVTIEP